MSTPISAADAEAVKDLDAIDAEIPDESIIPETTDPVPLTPVITLGTITETGLPVSSTNTIRQHADVASKEQQSGKKRQLSSSIEVSEASIVTRKEDGGDTERTTFGQQTIAFQIRIPISIVTQ